MRQKKLVYLAVQTGAFLTTVALLVTCRWILYSIKQNTSGQNTIIKVETTYVYSDEIKNESETKDTVEKSDEQYIPVNKTEGLPEDSILKYELKFNDFNTTDEKFECINGTAASYFGTRTTFPMCIFKPEEDVYISAALKQSDGDVGEMGYVQSIIQRMSIPMSDVGFIDIGANIGVYTLPLATLGHQVVAVEPMPAAAQRLSKSVRLGGIEDRVTLIQAGISNVTENLYLRMNKKNKGGSQLVSEKQCRQKGMSVYGCDIKEPVPMIFMDDLLEVVTFKSAVMKVSCGGLEYQAFKKADKLLNNLQIPFILMDFARTAKWWPDPKVRKEIDKLILYMREKEYSAMTHEGHILSRFTWRQWPNHIVWSKYDFSENFI